MVNLRNKQSKSLTNHPNMVVWWTFEEGKGIFNDSISKPKEINSPDKQMWENSSITTF